MNLLHQLLRKLVKPAWRIRHTRNGETVEFWAQSQAELAANSRNAWLDREDVSPLYGRWVAEKNR